MPKTKKKVKKSKINKKITPQKISKKNIKKPAKKVGKKSVKKTVKKAVKKPAKKSKSKKVMAIPKGYNNITPYLIIDGCAKAIAFYKNVFGAKLKMSMENAGKIAHAELQIGDTKIMIADECSEKNAHAPKAGERSGICIHLYAKDVDAVIERAIRSGATVIRAVEDTFYGDRSGGIQDPFGHVWFVATHIENVTPGQLKKRMAVMHAQAKAHAHADHDCTTHA